MVESETSGLSEKVMLDAVKFGHEKFVPIIEAIEKLAKKAGKPKWEVEEIDHSSVKKKIAEKFEAGLRSAFKEIDKKKRSTAISEIETQCKEMFAEDESLTENQVMAQLKSLEKDIVRTAILKDKKRIDGVRNYQAAKNLKSMKNGDQCFFYHSNIGKEIVGIVRVIKEAFVDKTDKKKRFVAVQVRFQELLKFPVSLEKIKKTKTISHLPLIKQSRLSVMPIDFKSWKIIYKMGKIKLN